MCFLHGTERARNAFAVYDNLGDRFSHVVRVLAVGDAVHSRNISRGCLVPIVGITFWIRQGAEKILLHNKRLFGRCRHGREFFQQVDSSPAGRAGALAFCGRGIVCEAWSRRVVGAANHNGGGGEFGGGELSFWIEGRPVLRSLLGAGAGDEPGPVGVVGTARGSGLAGRADGGVGA